MAEEEKMTRNQRYHALHREERCSKRVERYQNSPEVIAKREEHARKKAEKELAKQAEQEAKKAEKMAEKERARQERLQLAIATRKRIRKTGALDTFLAENPPVSATIGEKNSDA